MAADVSPSRRLPVLPAPRTLVWVVLAVAAVAFFARLVPEPRTIDDAFITFRYSRNLVEGSGFVYNPGERILGTTTPLYTLLMAAFGFVSGSENYPWFALIVNSLADAGTSGLLALMAWRLSGRVALAGLMGVLWAINPVSVTFAVGGMETSVAILWMAAATYAYLTCRERWMIVLAALGALTRIDALIWVGLLLLHHAITCWRAHPAPGRHLTRRVPWKLWTLFVALLLPWFAFSWLYFGQVLPRSLFAKRMAYDVADLQALTRFMQQIATPFSEHETFGVPAIAVGIVLYPGLAMIGLLTAAKRAPRLVPFVAYPWLYSAIFSLANPLIFRWYLAPLLPGYYLAILAGLWALVAASVRSPRRAAGVLTGLGALLVLFLFNAWVLHPDHGPDRPAPGMAWHKIELLYQQVGERLRDEYGVSRSTLVGAGDIGALGYFSRARILDTVGLVSPEAAAYYPVDRSLFVPGMNYAVPPQLVYDQRPEYLVLMEAFIRHGLARDERFLTQYEQMLFIPTDFYGTGMLVYRLRSAHSFAAIPLQ